jgi:hypothetical protein
VSAYDLAPELAQPSDDLARLWPAGGDVAEADDLFDSAASRVGEDGVEGDAITVDVADQGEADHARLASEPSPRPFPPSRWWLP